MSKEKLVGITTEGNKVWQTSSCQKDLFIIEGRYDGQTFVRPYRDCYKWVTFFKPFNRKFHEIYSKKTSEDLINE